MRAASFCPSVRYYPGRKEVHRRERRERGEKPTRTIRRLHSATSSTIRLAFFLLCVLCVLCGESLPCRGNRLQLLSSVAHPFFFSLLPLLQSGERGSRSFRRSRQNHRDSPCQGR